MQKTINLRFSEILCYQGQNADQLCMCVCGHYLVTDSCNIELQYFRILWRKALTKQFKQNNNQKPIIQPFFQFGSHGPEPTFQKSKVNSFPNLQSWETSLLIIGQGPSPLFPMSLVTLVQQDHLFLNKISD